VGFEQDHLMRDAIQNLAKAAVTGLVKPDDLVVEAGHRAIDLLFSWLPGRDKSRLERLTEEVAGELQELADREFAGNADLEPAIGNATTLFEQHGFSASDLIALNLDADRATETLLKRGEHVFRTLEVSVADLCRRHLVPQVVGRLLVDPQLIKELKPAITSTVLARLDEIRQLLKEEPRQRVDVDGQGNIVVQVIGDDNRIDLGRPYLRLTRYLARRVDASQRSDAELLSPYSRSIPLIGRDEELADLRAWLASGKPISIRVLTGPAGSGKTRLALELCEEMFELGWAAGFVDSAELARFQDKQNLAAWDWERPTLLVIDYAAVHAARLNMWFGELADHAGASKPLRILLLERNAETDGGWWQTAFGRGGFGARAVQRLLDPPEPVPLLPMATSSERRSVIGETLEEAGSDQRPPEEGADPAFDQQLAELSWGGEPLFLMMAGLMGKDVGMANVLSLGRTDLAFELAERELARITRIGEANDVNPDFMEAMAAYVTLCRGLDATQMRAAVPAEQEALGLPSAGDPGVVAKLLCEALPGASGASPILPDMIGEAAILSALPKHYEDVGAVVVRAFDLAGPEVAASISRTTQDFAEAGHVASLEWLDALIERESIDVGQLMLIADVLPQTSLALAQHGVRIHQTVAGTLQEEVRGGNTHRLPSLGVALNKLANYLSEVGQDREALASARRAANLYRALDAHEPNAFRPELAVALNNLANRLSKVGQHQEALAAAKKAVDLYRALDAHEPNAFRPELAVALNNLANRLSEVGHRQEALAAVQEAANLYTELAAKAPDAHRTGLARALTNLANRLREVDQRQKALGPAKEAVDIYRALAAGAPDAHRPILADALHNLAVCLSEVGQHKEALAATSKAVDLYRALTDKVPDAYRPGLAMALNTMAICLGEVGQHQKALAPAQEAVDLYRALAEEEPHAHKPSLAVALMMLANCLDRAGNREGGIDKNKEAIQVYTPCLTALPQAYAARAIAMVQEYLGRCEKLGRDPDGELLAPTLEVLKRTQQGSGEEAPGNGGP
jgi:tetratricopeptide (TPR) repeat protein